MIGHFLERKERRLADFCQSKHRRKPGIFFRKKQCKRDKSNENGSTLKKYFRTKKD